MSDKRYPVMHDRGSKACNGIVFYLTEQMRPGENLTAGKAIHVDGTPVQSGVPKCDSCGAIIHQLSIYAEGGVYHLRSED